MAKIINFPGMKEENCSTISLGRMTADKVEYNVSMLEASGVKREDAIKVMKALYKSRFFSQHNESKLTHFLFDFAWKHIQRKNKMVA